MSVKLTSIEKLPKKERELDIHSFRIWQGEENLDFEIIGSPIIGESWLTIRTLSKEIHFNISHIDRFEFT